MRKALAAKEGHEGLGKWGETITKIEQGRFSAEGIANEHGDEIDHFIGAKSGTSKAHPLLKRFQETGLGQHLRHDGGFSKPGRG